MCINSIQIDLPVSVDHNLKYSTFKLSKKMIFTLLLVS